MFTASKRNTIENEAGVSVEVLGRTGLRYRDASRSYFVDAEVVSGPSGLLIYASSIRYCDVSSDAEPVSETKRAEIVENIREAFRSQGYEIGVC